MDKNGQHQDLKDDEVQKGYDDDSTYQLKSNTQMISSQYKGQYENFFYSQEDVKKSDFTYQTTLKELSQSQNIQINKNFNQDHHQNKFSVVQIKPTNSPEIYQIFIHCGVFYTKLIILINPNKFNFSTMHIFDEGSSGTIFLLKNKQNLTIFAVKCFKFRIKNQFGLILLNVLKQYMFALIMSELQIGPKLTKDFGFDILIYSNCIQFSMQFCSKVNYKVGTDISLKENLLKMHALNIVHLDIKPQNVAFSNFYQRQVFIDFGNTQLATLKQGYKFQLKGFIGSYQYSSPQMKKCLYQKNFVDLYYNDVYGLKKTISQLQIRGNINFEYMKFSNQQESFQCLQKQFQQLCFMQTKLKFYLYKQNMHKIKNLIQIFSQFKNIQNNEDIIRFFKIYVPNSFLQQFYKLFLSNKFKKQQNKSYFDQKFKRLFKFQLSSSSNLSQIQSKNKNNMLKNSIIQIIKNQLVNIQIKNRSQNAQICKQMFDQRTLYRKLLLNQNISKNSQYQIEAYFFHLFQYITFQENYFQASFQQKQKVVDILIKQYKIDYKKHLQYQVSKPKLLKFIVCIKYLLDYCSAAPFTQIKKKLFPKLCVQFFLINPDIFTQRHPVNYFQKWYIIAYQQNKQNLLQIIVQLLQISFIKKIFPIRNCQMYYENFMQGDYNDCLNFLWKNKQYLLQQLKTETVVRQFKRLINIQPDQGESCQKFHDYLNLKIYIKSNNKISQASKNILLKHIHLDQSRQSTGTAQFKQKFTKILYLSLNSRKLSEQSFILCAYLKQRYEFFNCRESLKNIDCIINCHQISQNYFGIVRAYLYVYQGKRECAIKLYQKLVLQLNQNVGANNLNLIQLIQLQNTLGHQITSRQLKSYQEMLQLQNIKNITKVLLQKLKKIVQNTLIQIKLHDKCINLKKQLYSAVFYLLRDSIKSILTQSDTERQFLYYFFNDNYKQIQKFSRDDQGLLRKVRQFNISQYCIKMLSAQNYSSVSHFLIEKINNVNLNNVQELENHMIQCFYFVRSYFLQLQVQKWSQNTNAQIYQKYEEVLTSLCHYLVKKEQYHQSLSYDAPTTQLSHFLMQKNQYYQFFQFLISICKYLYKRPTSIYVSAFIRNLQYIRSILAKFNIEKFDQILDNFFKFQYQHKNSIQKNNLVQKKQSLNPYWYLIANELLYWSTLSATEYRRRTLKKIAICMNKLIFKAKQFLYEKYYRNFIFVIDSQSQISTKKTKKTRQYNNKLNRKRKYLWKKHLRIPLNQHMKLQFIFQFKYGLMQKQLKRYPHYFKSFYEKFKKFHQNLNNFYI